MSAGVAKAPIRAVTNTRRFPRFPLSVPADVTVLHAGIPYTIPGRSITLGEGGLGLALAGEVRAGDPVGLEFRLPDSGGRLRLKAVVRYQALLQCGLEFVSLTAEQQTLIEHWTRRKAAQGPEIPLPSVSTHSPASPVGSRPFTAPPVAARTPAQKPRRSLLSRPVVWVATALALMIGAVGGWYWHRAWDELESQLPESEMLIQPATTTVPAEVMQKLLTHKIEPIYPEAARQANIQGIVVLDTVIGADGTVADVRAISGPDELAPAAVDAVKWWRFQPYRVNGRAVQVKTTLAVEFRKD